MIDTRTRIPFFHELEIALFLFLLGILVSDKISWRDSSAFLPLELCPFYTGLTFSALVPFGPRPSVNDTRCPCMFELSDSGSVMDIAGLSIDETKTLVRQLLDRAFCHLQSDS